MKLNAAPNAARSANPIAPMKPLQVKTGVRAGLVGRVRVPPTPCDLSISCA